MRKGIRGKQKRNILLEVIDVHIVLDIKLYKEKMISRHLHPKELLLEWDYDKNTISPDMIALRYSKKVWWKCCNNHQWKSSPDNRFKHSPFSRCPYCTGQLVAKGETDLATKFPDILNDFNFEKNRKSPDQIHWGSTQKIWWKCHICGHEWRCQVSNRTKIGCGCPKCHGR